MKFSDALRNNNIIVNYNRASRLNINISYLLFPTQDKEIPEELLEI